MNQRQNALYWREWSAAKRALMPGREPFTKAEEEARRHELHVQALGDDKSHLDFNNDDFDHVLAAFRALSRPGDLNAQLHAIGGQRKRLLFVIRSLAKSIGVGDRYVAAIVERMNAEGKLGSSDLDQLHPRKLTKVMIALRQHEKRGAVQEPELIGEPF